MAIIVIASATIAIIAVISNESSSTNQIVNRGSIRRTRCITHISEGVWMVLDSATWKAGPWLSPDSDWIKAGSLWGPLALWFFWSCVTMHLVETE